MRTSTVDVAPIVALVYRRLDQVGEEFLSQFDAGLLVGASGPIVDMKMGELLENGLKRWGW